MVRVEVLIIVLVISLSHVGRGILGRVVTCFILCLNIILAFFFNLFSIGIANIILHGNDDNIGNLEIRNNMIFRSGTVVAIEVFIVVKLKM